LIYTICRLDCVFCPEQWGELYIYIRGRYIDRETHRHRETYRDTETEEERRREGQHTHTHNRGRHTHTHRERERQDTYSLDQIGGYLTIQLLRLGQYGPRWVHPDHLDPGQSLFYLSVYIERVCVCYIYIYIHI